MIFKFDKDLEEPGYINNTALHYSAEKGHFEIAKFLIDSKANIEAKNATGNTPLILSSACKNPNVVELLLDCNANIQAINNADVTPLHAAAYYGRYKNLECLIKRGAKIEVLAKSIGDLKGDNNTPLHLVCCNTHGDKEETVRILLQNKANIDAKDTLGFTPLHIASYFGRDKLIRLLMDYGADYKSVNNEGKKPNEIAKTPQISELILQIHRQLKKETKIELMLLKQRVSQLEKDNMRLDEKNKQLDQRVKELEQIVK